jgi:hypothetical protein
LTYGLAVVAVTGNFALSTAKVDAGVFLGVAPSLPVALRHAGNGHFAAGDDGAVALGGGKASKGRGRDEERRVAHGELVYGAESINAYERKQSQREINSDRRWRAVPPWKRQLGAQSVECVRVRPI